MKCRIFTKIFISVCHNINLIYILCIVNVYLCSVNGLLKYARSGLTSFSGFRWAALVSYVWRFNCFEKRNFYNGCFFYYKAK